MKPRHSILEISLLLLLFTGCRQSGPNGAPAGETGAPTIVHGTLSGGGGQDVILEEMAAREFIPIDTVVCEQDGGFRIAFSTGHTAFYALRLGTPGYITLLVEPGETVTFNGTYGDRSRYSVEGSPGSEKLHDLYLEHRKALNELSDIATENTRLMGTRRFAEMKPGLDRRFDSVSAAFRSYSLDFIKQNRESLAILIALYNMYGQGLYVFDPGEYPEVYALVDSVLYPVYAGNEMVDLLHAQVAEAKAATRFSGSGGLPVGTIAPDFVSSQPDGTTVALSDFRGNYVLLAFWAGWSHPSREENRVLKTAWDLYKDKRFRILQVSFDDERISWLTAIEKDGLTWTEVSDLERWDSPAADLYQVDKIPSNYLIGPGGKIVAKDVFGRDLLKQLEEIFNAKE